MKRRDLFKMLATLAAMPLVAPLAAWCKSKSDGFTHVQRVTGMRVISTGLTANDDLFGRVGEVNISVDSAVREGAEDHWHHGSTMLTEIPIHRPLDSWGPTWRRIYGPGWDKELVARRLSELIRGEQS